MEKCAATHTRRYRTFAHKRRRDKCAYAGVKCLVNQTINNHTGKSVLRRIRTQATNACPMIARRNADTGSINLAASIEK